MDDTKQGYIVKQAFDQKELRDKEALCTQQEPPNCETTCPIHVNVRELCDEMKQGNFDKARKILEKSTLFPNCLVYGCEKPCETGCVRSEIDQGLQIRKLEKAAMQFGKKLDRMILPVKKRVEQIQIIGGSVSSIALAAELGKKGYSVQIFLPQKKSFSDVFFMLNQKERSFWEQDFEFFQTVPVDFCWGALPEKKESIGEKIIYIIEKEWAEENPENQTNQQLYVFVPETTLIDQLSQGKSMALTVDRGNQNVTSSVGREREGSYQTSLFTNLEQQKKQEPVYAVNVDFSREEAREEANRCIHCECMECVKACGFLQFYHKYPRQAIREIYNNLSIVMGNHMANSMINSCSICGQCKAICPNGFNLGETCLLARNVMVETKKMPVSTFDFALKDMDFSNKDSFFVKHQPGYTASKCIFFPGCQMIAIAPSTVEKVYQDLVKRMSGGVGLMTGCCGAIAQWAGEEKKFREQIDFLETEWEQMGKPIVILGCTTCMDIFHKFTHIPVKGIWNVLEEIGLPETNTLKSMGRKKFQLHDACGARNYPEIQKSIRNVIEKLGYDIVEEEWNQDQSGCCGYGGLTQYSNPLIAEQMAQLITNQSDFGVLTYCMNCREQFVKQGKESYHLLELIYGMNSQEQIDISMKRFFRLLFKANMLEQYWGEKPDLQEQTVVLRFTDEGRKEMNQRMILESDVIEVMETLSQNGSVRNVFTSEYYTCKRIGEVTFWVKYCLVDEQFEITGAYSHRMEVEVDQ